jgi:PAS domain S-box-containing protein
MMAKKKSSIPKKKNPHGRSPKAIHRRSPGTQAGRRRTRGERKPAARADLRRPDLPAEATAETERRLFLQVLDTLPVYLVLLSPDHHVPFANRFFRKRFGESRGRRCFEYLFHRSEPCEKCESFTPFNTKTLHRWEWLGPDGHEYDIYDFPFTDIDGSSLVMETGIDITERKRAEAALSETNAALEQRVAERTADLAESERRWATTLASIGDAVIASDREGRIIFMNPAAETLTGWRLRDAAGKPAGEVVHIIGGSSRKQLEDPVAKVLAECAVSGPADHPLLVRRDGTEIAIDDSGAPIQGPDGKVTGVVLIFRDAAAQRAAEREIRNLAKFPEENPNPVLRVDRTGTILFANKSGSRMLGSGPAEKGRALPPDWLALAERALAAGRIETAELPAAERIWLAAAAPIAGEGYANIYAVDISERRKKEDELARLNRTLQAISESNQAMMRARDEQGFMDAVCRIIVQSCGHAMVWIGLAEDDETKTVRPVSYSGFEEGYLETLKITWADSERGRGPTGTAIRSGKASICRNMHTDPAFAPWRAEALKRGYASSIALPLTEEGRTFGALMIYARDPDPFSDEEVALLAELASDLAYGIQSIRARTARNELLAQVEEQRALAQQLADEMGAIFSSISEAVLVYDSGGRIRRANAAALKMLGFDPAHLSTEEIAARLNTRHLDGRPLEPADYPTVRALRGAPVKGERYLLTGAGGLELIAMTSASPLFEGGHLSGVVTVIHDVTEQEKAVSGMERKAAELNAVINSIGDGIMIYGTHGELVRMNPAAEKMMDYNPEERELPFEQRSRQAIQIETPDGRPVTNLSTLPISKALRGKAVHGRELALRQVRTGKITWVNVTAEPLRAADGTVFGAVSSLTDITWHKESQEALQKSEGMLRGILNASQESIWLFHADGRILAGNPIAFRRFGKPPEEVVGKHIREILPPALAESRLARLNQVVESKQPAEFEDERAGIVFRHSFYPVTDSAGHVTSISCFSRDVTASNQAEEALRASEARFRSVLDHSRDVIYRIDLRSGRFEYISPSVANILGYGTSEFLSQDHMASWDMVHPEDLIALEAAIARLETTGQEKVEYRQRAKNGKYRWISNHMSLVRDDAGRPLYRDGNIRDITEQKQTEAELRRIGSELERQISDRTRALEEANTYNRSLIEATLDPMVTIFADGRIGDANTAAEAVTGYPRAELIGRDFSDCFTDPDKARAGYRRAFAEGKVSDYELEIRHRDGRVTPVLYNAAVYTDEGMKVRGVIAVARDITRRRQAESLARENTRRIEGLAEISHLLAGAGPEYEPVLPRIAQSTAQLIGEECWIHLPTGDGRLHLAARRKAEGGDSKPLAVKGFEVPVALAERAFQSKQPLFLPTVSRRGILQSGTPEDLALLEGAPLSSLMILPLLSLDRPLGVFTLARYTAGKPYTQADLDLLTTVTDRVGLMITNSNLFQDLKQALAEEQKARQQLIHSEKLAAMGRMLASVAHELNNPLQTIKNCLYLVQQEVPANPSIENYVGMATSETSRLVNLVAQLRELYRQPAESKMHPHDLGEILREVNTLLKPQLKTGNVQWRQLDFPGDRTVSCDKERIQQVFINLTSNAIEAMQPSGGILTVSLRTSENPRRLGVVFRDSGPGIPPELIDNIFDPFVTTKSTGLGLGLSICYEIAQKHGGTISVENPAGGGAEFMLWLPRE